MPVILFLVYEKRLKNQFNDFFRRKLANIMGKVLKAEEMPWDRFENVVLILVLYDDLKLSKADEIKQKYLRVK